ncbi:nuclear protein 1b [Heptranchias perlo]|uniref:nuclear protein 1b n=1 Tax=Heptranchias perlo TaxID=212740 RepID=UPI003559A3B7
MSNLTLTLTLSVASSCLRFFSQLTMSVTLCWLQIAPTASPEAVNLSARVPCSSWSFQSVVSVEVGTVDPGASGTPGTMSSDSLESFEEAHYDEYEYYNLEDYPAHSGGKGRSKKEMGRNVNRHCPAGHERKIAEKLYNSELKRKRAQSLS